MKIKNLIRNMGMLFVLILVMASCSKEKQENELTTSIQNDKSSNFVVTLNDDVLQFKSFSDYSGLIDMEATEGIEALDKIAEIKSFKKALKHRVSVGEPDDVPEVLLKLLNEDGVVGIGDYLFKLNFEERKVYTLLVKDKDKYRDLVKGANIDEVRAFSFDQDVLSILENENIDGERSMICFLESWAVQKDRVLSNIFIIIVTDMRQKER